MVTGGESALVAPRFREALGSQGGPPSSNEFVPPLGPERLGSLGTGFICNPIFSFLKNSALFVILRSHSRPSKFYICWLPMELWWEEVWVRR